MFQRPLGGDATYPARYGRLALCFIDYAAELPYFRDEALLRLVDMGVRRPG
ncbi:hypothetical protein [Sorangium sp. So ce363]|uniref:hypothetical protein n=1 Tax=Sorangium sp. So ce363 TaxID=3133304 RepID=UPI003F614698